MTEKRILKTTGRESPFPTVEEKRQAYLDNLAYLGTLTGACEAAGISNASVYTWRSEIEDFQDLEKEAIAAFTDRLETAAIDRAKTRSDLLMIFLLKAFRPERYRDATPRVLEVKGGTTNTVEHHFVQEMPDDELNARLAALEARERRIVDVTPRETPKTVEHRSDDVGRGQAERALMVPTEGDS